MPTDNFFKDFGFIHTMSILNGIFETFFGHGELQEK